MKIENKNEGAKLEFFRTLYQNSKNAYSEVLEGFSRNMQQYRGSVEIDGSRENAITVRNITYEIVESQVSSDIPHPKADALCYSERREQNALAIERLISSLRDKLPFEEMNDLDERYTYIYGGSVWFVEWDNSAKRGNEIGDVKIYCLSPKDFIPEPNVYSVNDMDYCFLRFTTTRGELGRKYGISDSQLHLAECEMEDESFDSGDTVSVILAFYKDEEGNIGQFIFSGSLVLSDVENYYKRKIKRCTKCSQLYGECACEEPDFAFENQDFEELSEHDGFGEALKVPYYVPKTFPIVIRKNTSAEKCLFGQSDCEYIRPEQQAINKIESRILQKLLRSGITPVVPEDASVSLNNSVFGQIIKMRPGESMSQYGTVDTTPDISQDIAEAERLYEHAKRTLGITDAYQGVNQNYNESGYARQLKIAQASGRLESKRKMKHTAYSALDKIIFEYYLAFADEPRSLTYKDSFGRVHNSAFNRYDFLELNITTGEYEYDDGYLFSVDLNGGAEYQREALWERNLQNLTAGTLGDASSPETLLRYWQCQERAHYPYARENVEYFRELTGKEKPINE